MPQMAPLSWSMLFLFFLFSFLLFNIWNFYIFNYLPKQISTKKSFIEFNWKW